MVFILRAHSIFQNVKGIKHFSDSSKYLRSVLVLGIHNLFQQNQYLTPLSKYVNKEMGGKLLSEIERLRSEQNIISESEYTIPPAAIIGDIKYRSFSKIHLVNLPSFIESTEGSTSLHSLGYSLEGDNGCWGSYEKFRYSEWVRCQSALAILHNKHSFLHLDAMRDAKSVAEGVALASFKFNLKSHKTELIDTPRYCLHDYNYEVPQTENSIGNWEEGVITAQMQNFARMLSELPSNILDPEKFVDEAIGQINQLNTDSLSFDVRHPSWIQSNLPGVHHVAKGSKAEPRFLTLSYRGGDRKDDNYVIIGKGVVFDSGGISIKPSASMELMRGDMSGAAIALSTILGCAALKSKVNLICLIPLVENMPSSSALKPGDLITMHNGKTVIVNNTDAEGRLILADTLSYSNTFNPKLVVNIATLTGASDVALGDSYSALFSNCAALSEKLSVCGVATGELLWPLPLHYDYLAALRKSNADLNNISAGRSAGSGVGAAFLSEFVDFPWAHIDIGGSMMQKSGSIPYLKSDVMSGRPTRALIKFFSNPTLSSYGFAPTPRPYSLTPDKYQPAYS